MRLVGNKLEEEGGALSPEHEDEDKNRSANKNTVNMTYGKSSSVVGSQIGHLSFTLHVHHMWWVSLF